MPRISEIRFFGIILWTVVILCPASSAHGQPGSFGDLSKIPKLGEIRGLTSFSESHLAVWYSNVKTGQTPSYEAFLVIYEMKNQSPVEVFRLNSNVEDFWQKLIPLSESRLTGLIIQSSQSFTEYDAALLIALVGGKFQVVFRGGSSEVVDLNADGIPEILESMWPDSDGFPKTTTVHVSNGKTYTVLKKVAWSQRFSPQVRLSVEAAARRLRQQRERSPDDTTRDFRYLTLFYREPRTVIAFVLPRAAWI